MVQIGLVFSFSIPTCPGDDDSLSIFENRRVDFHLDLSCLIIKIKRFMKNKAEELLIGVSQKYLFSILMSIKPFLYFSYSRIDLLDFGQEF